MSDARRERATLAHARRAQVAAGERDRARLTNEQLRSCERDLEDRSVRRVAHEEVGDRERPGVAGAARWHPEVRGVRSSAILDRREEARREDFEHALLAR